MWARSVFNGYLPQAPGERLRIDAEVDGTRHRCGLEQVEQIVEGLSPLLLEAVVLVGVPPVGKRHDLYGTCI